LGPAGIRPHRRCGRVQLVDREAAALAVLSKMAAVRRRVRCFWPRRIRSWRLALIAMHPAGCARASSGRLQSRRPLSMCIEDFGAISAHNIRPKRSFLVQSSAATTRTCFLTPNESPTSAAARETSDRDCVAPTHGADGTSGGAALSAIRRDLWVVRHPLMTISHHSAPGGVASSSRRNTRSDRLDFVAHLVSFPFRTTLQPTIPTLVHG